MRKNSDEGNIKTFMETNCIKKKTTGTTSLQKKKKNYLYLKMNKRQHNIMAKILVKFSLNGERNYWNNCEDFIHSLMYQKD